MSSKKIISIFFFVFLITIELFSQDISNMQSYSIKIEKTISFDSLSISRSRLSLKFGKGSLALIECEKGITGVVILSKGSFSFRTDDSEPIYDSFNNVMLRFNPIDYQTFIRPINPQSDSQPKTKDESMNILKKSFKFLYHKGKEALIPDIGALGSVIYSHNLGNLIIVDGIKKPIVFSLEERQLLFEGLANDNVPIFQNISHNWNQTANHLQMDEIWGKENLDASGDNYFHFPIPVNGKIFSQRFDPNSIYFQSWFGMYIVKDVEDRRYAFDDDKFNARAILQLAVADQQAWLKNFAGLRNPNVAIDTSFSIATSKVTIANQNALKISARLISNVDVGDNNPHSGQPKLLLVSPNLWNESVKSYSQVLLDVVAYVLHNANKGESYVIYYNGVDFLDKTGKRHRTITDIQEEMESMIFSLNIVN